MMCQLCGKRPANVCINIDINGVRSQKFICEKCAEERKLRDNPTGAVILALVNDIRLANEGSQADDNLADNIDRTCFVCGTTYSDYAKTSKLGCPECYESFKDLLEPVLEKITKPSPESELRKVREKQNKEIRSDILKLQMQLKKCVENEDYENAAVLRDKIAQLKAQTEEVSADG